MARRTVSALALLALAVPATAAAKDKAHWTNYSRPATYGVARDANVAIPMSDGITLRALGRDGRKTSSVRTKGARRPRAAMRARGVQRTPARRT